jgi:hypothetical protein
MIASWKIVLVICWGIALAAHGQTTNTVISVADAFLCTGSSNYENGADLTGLNFGAAGALVVAPASGPKGEFQSVLRFDVSSSKAAFDLAYGSNLWTITGISLELTGNFGAAGEQPNNSIFPQVSGGSFVIEWLAEDTWIEGNGTPNLPTTDGVTYNSLPELLSGNHEILGTNSYVPPGDNVPESYALPLRTNLLSDIRQGGAVSLLFYAADNQIGYLFNSYNYGRGNEPKLQIMAVPVLRLVSGAFVGGAFQLSGLGGTNTIYNVQASTNLAATNWVTIGTATADALGQIQYRDTQAAAEPRRFYRLSQ